MMRERLWALTAAALLAACGGGGGSDSAASFTPGVLKVNYRAGTSASVTLDVRVHKPSDFSDGQVYVVVADRGTVLQGGVELVEQALAAYTATFHTSGQLAKGHYTGSLSIRLCKDEACRSQYPGSPLSLPYDLTVTDAPLTTTVSAPTAITNHTGEAAPADVRVTVAGDQLAWTATSASPWLRVNQGSGMGAGAFTVSLLPSGLAIGEYEGQVVVSSQDGQSSSVPFKLSVLQAQFSLSSAGVPAFTAVNGAPIAAQPFEFEVDNKVASPWTATNDAAWMVASPLNGTTPGRIDLQPDPSRGPLAAGTYTANLLLSSLGIPDRPVASTLTLLSPTLSASTNAVTFGGEKGRDLSAQTFTISLNTGSAAWGWSLSSLPEWLSASATSDRVSASGTVVTLSVDPAKVPAGSTSTGLTLSSPIHGDLASAPVTVNLNADQRRLLVSEPGVAFASTPTGSLLTRSLTVKDNFGAALTWTAQSNAAWLSVTGSGAAGGALTLNADASALPSDAVSYATVTVSSATSGVAPARVRVGLWKSAQGAVALLKQPLRYQAVTADRIRPYVYAHDRGSSIDVFNAYTGQKISTVSAVGAALDAMAVSPDGSTLYVVDTANRSAVLVDLDSLAVRTTWQLNSAAYAGGSATVLQPNGVEVLLLNDGSAYADGQFRGSMGLSGAFTATPDGSRVYSNSTGVSPTTAARADLDYSAMSGGVLLVSGLRHSTDIGSNGLDISVSRDGQRVYAASGAPYQCAVLQPNDLGLVGHLPGGDAYPNNVEVTWDGRAICGISGWYAANDFWVHSANGMLIGGYKVAGYAKALLNRQMVVTPDGMVVVALTDDPVIAFVAIGP